MSGTTDTDRSISGDRRAARRAESIEEILDAAWELSRANGLGNFSMRELGTRVGMRAQSLYSYFASKHELFDAMFAVGNRQMIERLEASEADTDEVETLHRAARRFFWFCVEDPARYQLLFQRTLPGFEPSEQSYALAQLAYDRSVAPLRARGVSEADLDLVTAVVIGLVAQQIANDPGGDRWGRLVDRAVDMLAREILATPGGARDDRIDPPPVTGRLHHEEDS